MLTYRIVTTVDELKVYETVWNRILHEEQNNNPFIEFDWVYYWWQLIAENERIQIYVILQNEEPIAFIPLKKKKRLSISIFSFVTFPEANYMDIVARKENLKQSIHYLFQTLESCYPHAVYQLNGLLESSEASAHIESYFIERDNPYRLFRTVCPFIPIKQLNTDQLVNKKRNIHGINRRLKRLSKLGEWQFIEAEDAQFFNIVSIYKKRWKKTFSNNRFAEFHVQQLFQSIAKTDSAIDIRVHALTIEGKWVAFALGVCCRDRYIVYMLGHDPAFDLFGPGRIVDQLLIQTMNKEEYSLFDLSTGYANYKYDWDTTNDFVRTYMSSTQSLRAKLMSLLLTTKHLGVSYVKKTRWMNRFKRNVLDKLYYSLRFINIKELLSLGKQLLTIEWINIYEKQLDQVVPKNKRHYIEQRLKDLKWDQLNVSLLYKGYRFFKEEGITKNSVFIYHDEVLRYDEVALLEPLPPNAVFLSRFEESHMKEIYEYFSKQHIAKMITINQVWNKRRTKKLIQEMFICKRQIFYMKFLKWEFRKVKGVAKCKSEKQTHSLQSISTFSKKQ